MANLGEKASTLVAYYHNEIQRKADEWKKSPAGRRAQRAAQKRARKREQEAKKPLASFSVKDEGRTIWEESTHCSDDYIRDIVRFAARWANFMETAMKQGARLENIAGKTSSEADIEGMSGNSYAYAVKLLWTVWEHGEQLRLWHNAQYGYEGDGVINPARITIAVPVGNG